MNTRFIYVILFFSLLLLSLGLNVVYADWQPNIPSQCEVKAFSFYQLVIWCSEDVLFTDYGLFISVDYSAGYKSVSIGRNYDLLGWRWVITVIFTVNDDEGRIHIGLPPNTEYAGRRVDAWNFTYWYCLDPDVCSQIR